MKRDARLARVGKNMNFNDKYLIFTIYYYY